MKCGGSFTDFKAGEVGGGGIVFGWKIASLQLSLCQELRNES